MQKDIKEKWIAALRSGEYKQGKKVLKSENNEYCCLGLLCQISPFKDNFTEIKNRYGSTNSVLPNCVMEYTELTDNDPIVLYNNCNLRLSTLNDVYDKTFNEIADIIEEQL